MFSTLHKTDFKISVTSILSSAHAFNLDQSKILLVAPLPEDKSKTSKLKEFADNNFKFDENGRKLSKRIENIVGKGEIARYEQFLLSPSVFKRLVSQGRQKVSLCGNGLKVTLDIKNLFHRVENCFYGYIESNNKIFRLSWLFI